MRNVFLAMVFGTVGLVGCGAPDALDNGEQVGDEQESLLGLSGHCGLLITGEQSGLCISETNGSCSVDVSVTCKRGLKLAAKTKDACGTVDATVCNF